MKYRKLDINGDYSFGHGDLDFHIDTPAGVAQAILTALKLFQGEWFLDTTAGVPWYTQIAGFNTQSSYDAIIRDKIQSVPGVIGVSGYTSNLELSTRLLTITAQIDTDFGETSLVTQILVSQTGYGLGGYGRRPYGE